MKKEKLKSLIKQACKTARKDIQLKLEANLHEFADKLVAGIKIEKEIAKAAKHLAKAIANELTIDEAPFIAADAEAKTAAKAAKAPKPAKEAKIVTEEPKPVGAKGKATKAETVPVAETTKSKSGKTKLVM